MPFATHGLAWIVAVVAVLSCHVAPAAEDASPWPRHTIDDSSRGADGVRLMDVNGDGLLDVATGWEEGGAVRAYLHPGHADSKAPWPAVTVGLAPSVEDAVFVDLDSDGAVDVVSSCEGKHRRLQVHWAPKDPARYLDADAWETAPLPCTVDRQMWMFCVPLQIDGRRGVDLIAGGKGPNAAVGWLQSPDDPRDLDAWTWRPISPAGWIMSLQTVDMDADGDLDLLLTDRKGKTRSCRWHENPGSEHASSDWPEHVIGGRDSENLFLARGDLDGDGLEDIVHATKSGGFAFHRRLPSPDGEAPSFETLWIDAPSNDLVGGGKAAAIADVDLDGRMDLVFTCESANAPRSGAAWLEFDGRPEGDAWTMHDISGPVGIKYDRIEMIDLDGDGDLDLMTCEERETSEGDKGGLGVFWYENPTR